MYRTKGVEQKINIYFIAIRRKLTLALEVADLSSFPG
jgi:hypothetical protein